MIEVQGRLSATLGHLASDSVAADVGRDEVIAAAIEELIPVVDVRKACEVTGKSQAAGIAGTAKPLDCPAARAPAP